MTLKRLGGACGAFALLTIVFGPLACSGDERPGEPGREFHGTPTDAGTATDAAKDSGRDGTVTDGSGSTQDATPDAPLVDGPIADGPIPDGSEDSPGSVDCNNGIKDGTETDVDCGSTCPKKCDDGKKCLLTTDCKNGVCTPGSTVVDGAAVLECKAPTCFDGVKNGVETDIDCGGGGNCGLCLPGKGCGAGTDCSSNSCTGGVCVCPSGMITMPAALQQSATYCIDQLEVSMGEYVQFWNASPNLSDQDSFCTWNQNYTPFANWPPNTDTASGGFNGNDPVRYVDWCDAWAFCKYRGKKLCGRIGGGANPQSDSGDWLKSQWYNACSAQGANVYPYGQLFDATKCFGNDTKPSPALNANGDAINRDCLGGAPALFNMSGNVGEWEDSCDNNPSTPDAGAEAGTDGGVDAGNRQTDKCYVRGGSFSSASDPNALRCTAAQPMNRNTQAADIGFRCCL